MSKLKLKRHSLMFAPMEGITDEYYRNVVNELYPEWDSFSCDFLRIPTTNPYPLKHIEKHIGKTILSNQELKDKTIYQILTSPGAYTKEALDHITQTGMDWVDLNLGCPSKTVCRHHGGSYLLSDLDKLQTIIKSIRDNFDGIFSCKIRVGYRDDSNFEKILKLLEYEGVDAIKIHGRTRDELYNGVAKWSYIKKAVETVNTPIIGNGDIWTSDDIEKYFNYTNCHSVMLGRPALKTPWLSKLYKNKITETPEYRMSEMIKYYTRFYQETLKQTLPEASRIKRLKSVSRYLYDDLPNGRELKKRFLLSKSFDEQMSYLLKAQSEL